MLSGVLRSKKAALVNIGIMRTFVQMRTGLSAHRELAEWLDELESRYDKKFTTDFEAIKQLMYEEPKSKKEIGFKLQFEVP